MGGFFYGFVELFGANYPGVIKSSNIGEMAICVPGCVVMLLLLSGDGLLILQLALGRSFVCVPERFTLASAEE